MTAATQPKDASKLASRLRTVRARIAAAEQRFDREPGSVRLLAVSKRHPVGAIAAMHATGQVDFGENYVDEGLTKMDELDEPTLRWHYIGPIQSNKTRAIATRFDWVQSIDRAKILRRIGAQRPAELPPISALLQVHIGPEETKSGAAAEDVESLADLALEFPALRLRGLMCIPPPEKAIDAQRAWFGQLRSLYATLGGLERGWDTLSMGMSGDLEAAIAEGATMVRIGTDLFGPREPAGRNTAP
ncbi:MAG: YggS family pyridoxal phosphate-dependent enzyme [Pseudomonadota bacterium]